MTLVVMCKVCGKKFNTKPFYVKRGQGIYCSRACHYVAAQKRVLKYCDVCGAETYKKPTQIKRSKSGKYFCGKSCQTKWRNAYFHGMEHPNYKDGLYAYRSVLLRNKVTAICKRCRTTDKRGLAVHHIDQNRKNNTVKNLTWLYHNCHHLIHRYPDEHKKVHV